MHQALMSRFRAIEQIFWPNGFTRDIWMIVDCARDPKPVFRFLLACHLEHSCLYSGVLPPVLEMAAPYLLQLDFDDDETRQLIELSWGNSWGVFLNSPTTFSKLRRHLREFLIVRGPQGRRMTFRYYDPRVLRSYLPTCTTEELLALFGPIDCFWTEDPADPDHVVEYRLTGNRLAVNRRSLKTARVKSARQ
jgi:hypothetical protein